VKNFTNFACGIGEVPIKFPRSSNLFVPAMHDCLMEFTVFCGQKTIDGEELLKRIHVRIGLDCSFVGNLTVYEK